MTAQHTGVQIILEVLKDEGVDTIFGYPGAAVIDLYDEMERSAIRHVLVRHEQGAMHAADGYARASNRVGVCLVTSGPGATNTITGLAAAQYGVPIKVVVLDCLPLSDASGTISPDDIQKLSQQMTHPDLVTLAESFGARGLKVDSEADLEEVLTTALSTEGPVVVSA